MQAREVIGRTPDSSYFSLSDWKGCTVTRYETTAYEYVGEREREGLEAAPRPTLRPAAS